MMKLNMIVGVLAALAVVNAGSVDVKLQDKKITITPTEDTWQQLVAPISEAAKDKCCTTCTAPKNKYFSIAHDSGKWLCGETCIRDSFFPIFHIFEKNLTKAASSTATVCAGAGYTLYDSTVTHGGGGLYCTLDLYACSKGEGNCEHPPAASMNETAVEQVQTTVLPVSSTLVSPLKSAVGPPCHFINRYNKNICSETNDTQSCRMGWERPGNCNDAGYTVCCQLYNDKYYFKAGLKCSDGIVAPGSQPYKPCDTTANIPDQGRQ